MHFFRESFIISLKGVSSISAAIFTNFGGILSGPVDFLGLIFFKIQLISSFVACGKEKEAKLDCAITFFLIFTIIGLSLKDYIISSTVRPSSIGSTGFPKFVGAMPVVVSTMFI